MSHFKAHTQIPVMNVRVPDTKLPNSWQADTTFVTADGTGQAVTIGGYSDPPPANASIIWAIVAVAFLGGTRPVSARVEEFDRYPGDPNDGDKYYDTIPAVPNIRVNTIGSVTASSTANNSFNLTGNSYINGNQGFNAHCVIPKGGRFDKTRLPSTGSIVFVRGVLRAFGDIGLVVDVAKITYVRARAGSSGSEDSIGYMTTAVNSPCKGLDRWQGKGAKKRSAEAAGLNDHEKQGDDRSSPAPAEGVPGSSALTPLPAKRGSSKK